MGFFIIHSVAKRQKIEGGKLLFSGKKSHNAEKTERFKHQYCRKTVEKMKCEGKIFSEKKSRSAKKIERGDPLVSPGMVCYAGKQEKSFWFNSLGQIFNLGP